MFRLTTTITLVTGNDVLMWLGEQITERGIGNGISIIIFSGIVAGLPRAVGGTLELARTGAFSIPLVLFLFAATVLVTAFVVFVERGSTQDYGELCQASGRTQGVWRSKLAFAAEAEYGRGDPAYLRFQYYFVPCDDGRLVWQ